MGALIDHTYLSVGEHRGAARIYLQGECLEKAGFVRGASYIHEPAHEEGVYKLRLHKNGSHTVCGKSKNNIEFPVIDVLNKTLKKVTGDADKVRVDFESGTITISISSMVKRQRAREAKLVEELQTKTISTGTLCVGGGMATLAIHEGLAEHGYTTKNTWIADREGSYLEVARRNNPAIKKETTVFQGALEEIDNELVKSVSLCQFSLSCCGHSRSGASKNKTKRAEEHATDATGVYGLMKLLEPINAAIYCSENVTESADSATYDLIKKTLVLLGYTIVDGVLDSSQSGSFERRPRYWFVAVSNGLPKAQWSEIPVYARKYASLPELLDPIPDDSEMWKDHQYLKDKAVRDKAAGKGFSRQLLDRDDHSVTHCGVINRTYHKRQSPPPMLVRKAVDDKERLMTLAEQARAKSCSPSLVANTCFTTGTEILGQGIDMMQGQGIAEMIALTVLNPLCGVPYLPEAVSNVVQLQRTEVTEQSIELEYEEVQQQLFL